MTEIAVPHLLTLLNCKQQYFTHADCTNYFITHITHNVNNLCLIITYFKYYLETLLRVPCVWNTPVSSQSITGSLIKLIPIVLVFAFFQCTTLQI